MHADLAQASMVSVSEEQKNNSHQEQFMVNGISEEKNTNNQYQITETQLQLKGESDFMADVINQRKEDITAIANIMNEINAMA